MRRVTIACNFCSPGGLDLSRHRQTVCLDSRENLDIFKKFVSTVEKSWSRSRLLDFVSTSMSRPKSLDRDRKIRRDLKILAFLDSLSWSRSRSAWIFAFSRQDFSIRRDFSSFSDSKGLDNVEISRQISTASWQILTISTRLDKSQQSRRVLTISTKISTRQSLDWKVSILKISTEKKNIRFRLSRKSWHLKKVGLDTKDNLDLDLDWSRLLRAPGLNFCLFFLLKFLQYLYFTKSAIYFFDYP